MKQLTSTLLLLFLGSMLYAQNDVKIFMNGTERFRFEEGRLLFQNSNSNIAIGQNTLLDASAQQSVALGSGALENYKWSGAIGIGRNALNADTSSFNNTAIGLFALASAVGSFNTAIGAFALRNNTTGEGNVSIGNNSLLSNLTGSENTAVGQYALLNNTGGHSNVAVGNDAGRNNSTGTDNTFIGDSAGQGNTTGGSNTIVGKLAGGTGSSNTVVGAYALPFGIGQNNVALGSNIAPFLISGSKNIFIGSNIAETMEYGNGNVFIGNESGRYAYDLDDQLYIENSDTINPLIYGDFSQDIVGINGNLGIGTQNPLSTLHVSSGNVLVDDGNVLVDDGNVFLEYGYRVEWGLIAGATPISSIKSSLSSLDMAAPSVTFRIAGPPELELWSLQDGRTMRKVSRTDASLTTNGDFMIGDTSSTNLIMDNNEIIARNNGSNSTLYLQAEGGTAKIGAGSTADGMLHIKQVGNAFPAIVMENNQNTNAWGLEIYNQRLHFEYNGVDKAEISEVDGSWITNSDFRLKRDIDYWSHHVLDDVLALRPASYRYVDNAPGGRKAHGFIAQEVEKLFPELVKSSDDGYLKLSYADFSVLAIKAIQELHAEKTVLEDKVTTLEDRLAALETLITPTADNKSGKP